MQTRFLSILFSAIALISPLRLDAAEDDYWFRQAAVSPDGEHIVFSYQGDIFKVLIAGGQAIVLTTPVL